MNSYISLSLSSKQREAFASDVLNFYVHQIGNCVSRFKWLMPERVKGTLLSPPYLGSWHKPYPLSSPLRTTAPLLGFT